jgi:predicted phage-related endonuclease
MLVELDSLKARDKASKERQAEIEAYFKEKCGDNEHIKVGDHDVYYKYINAAGTINEDALRADFPEVYLACAKTSIDAKKLSLEYPSEYNKVLISGSNQRRFSCKINIAKLVTKIKKNAETQCLAFKTVETRHALSKKKGV